MIPVRATPRLDGSAYVKRSPTGAWLLTVATLLVYFFVWYYKINDETRRYLRDDSIRPWHSVLAIFPGVLLVIPYFVSIYRTAERIRRSRNAPGAQSGFGRPWASCARFSRCLLSCSWGAASSATKTT
jgi:hypothetical protein